MEKFIFCGILLTFFSKRFIIDLWQGPKYTWGYRLETITKLSQK